MSDTYRVSEIFDTLSGEAPTAGTPATFIRLFGCSVKCRTCDTFYSVFKETRGFKKGYMQGLCLGDGHFTSDGYYIHIGMSKQESLRRLAQYWADVFDRPTPTIDTRVRSATALNPGATYYRLNLGGKDRVAVIKAAPTTPEERRGFVSGFFDAEGSCPKPQHNIEFTNGNEAVLDALASCLDDWSFRYTRSAGHNRQMGRNLYTLRLVSFAAAGNNLNPQDKKARREAEMQRFFDVYRPGITSKYGPWLRRWTYSELTLKAIASQCNEKLVVCSGGEPLEVDLDPLISELTRGLHTVQVETSGAFDFRGTLRPDILVCSPKPNMKYRIAPTVYESATIFKLVNGPPNSGFDWNESLASTLKRDGKRVFVMPYGGPPSKASITAAKATATAGGYEFSPRLHYELGLR